MRRLTALGAVLLVGTLGASLLAPSADAGLPIPTIGAISEAQAAIGRGEGASEGGQLGVFKRLGSFLQGEFAAVFYVAVAAALAVAVGQRNAGAAVALVVAAFVIGAFLLVPDQVEAAFRAIYNTVL